MILIVWQFRPAPGREADFETAYGPAGVWASFFRKSAGYRGTELAQDVKDRGRYLTLDRWDSEEAFLAFERAHATEYAAIDRECEPLCAEERFFGRFQWPVAPPG
jgi:heme-degrading monooxygenase HmoA